MIYETLEIIKDEISAYLNTKFTDEDLDDNQVVLENVSKVDDQSITTMKDKVVLTLLNIEEEISLKNNLNIKIKNGETVYKNNPVNLNIYIQFSANYTSYTKCLIAISHIIAYFQSKKIFTQTNTPLSETTSVTLDYLKEFRFTAELYTPTFEQLNYIWGTLGGKSLPSVMFKVSLVKIERDIINDKGKAITEISGILQDTNS
ncbi:DUF4255 domain-containing protein [Ulvibacter antarcticus]|uniref:Uncharacterized protein DUF4255 n=1 Tax=Ulvibacter antarcticus TaxID=442714 RepID=A0A3L9YDU9_9FLAO|nr:DUF4255 domain-containing protein [Ulvibacter antarcticus]RMA58876.1 uncharacterized protein DUF4255 [Ulvibacter antarcticus]